MRVMKKIFANKKVKIWFFVTSIVLVIILVADILAFGVLYDVIRMPLGGEVPIYDTDVESPYVAETADKEDALRTADKANIEFCEEGSVLLKNSDGALPISEGTRVSVFGKNSVNLVYGLSGSSAGDHSGAKTIFDSLEDANLSYNETLREFYEDNTKSGEGRSQANSDLDSGNEVSYSTGETPLANYDSNNIQASFETTDAAVIVLSRLGGEGADLPKSSTDSDSHYLALDDNELALVDMVTSYGFSSVTVVINSANVMELSPLKENPKVDAILWIGTPGDTGIMALGEILTGKVNPSGRTVDTYAADFTKDPSYNNFGYISDYYMSSENSNGILYNKWDGQIFFTRYQEGIYVGYRYYETADYEESQGNYEGFDYDNAVVYPFGYGLSYTTFEWEIKDDSEINGVTVDKDGTYSITVTVTNTGDVAGKDVVELYVSAPYTKGEIEKAYKVLCGYVKTGLLEPGESGDYTVEIDPYDFASYDYNDANQNGFSGYELDSGDYLLFVSRSAHEDVFEIGFNVPEEGIQYENDPDTGNTVENRFDDADNALGTVMSRADFAGTLPEKATDEYRLSAVTEEILESINSTANNNSETAGFTEMPTTGAEATVTLRDLLYDAETGEFVGSVDFDDPRWNAVLDAVTFDEMVDLVNYGNLMTKAIDSIGKHQTIESDGPTGFSSGASMDMNIYDTCAYCSEVVLASTWNIELVEKMGECLGEEALWGNGNSGTPYSAIYAPGANIHRSPFGGRNGEYYSEDSFLSGTMAASEISGARSKGLITYIKHFAVNEQETKRNGLVNWIDEQSLREIYLKPFEHAVKDGGTTGMMSSFTRIGTKWTGGDYRLLTEVLRGEWGFSGTVITDWSGEKYMNVKQMVYAGGDLNFYYPIRIWNSADSTNEADVTVLRKATKGILYSYVNSNAMNGEVIGYRMANWQIIAIVIECIICMGLAAWGFMVIRNAKKDENIQKNKNKEEK